jgi:hypothetical protein
MRLTALSEFAILAKAYSRLAECSHAQQLNWYQHIEIESSASRLLLSRADDVTGFYSMGF